MKTGMKILVIVSLGITIMSCSKGGGLGDYNGGGGGHVNNPSDTIPPVVTINTPAPDQVFNSGAPISVTGTIADNNGLYRGSIRITNDATGSVAKEQLYEIHGLTSYNFSVSTTAIVNTVTQFTVTVSFEDHGYNTTVRTVKIKVNP